MEQDLEQLFQRFNENISFLRSNSKVDIPYIEIHPPVEIESLERVMDKGFYLPETLIQFYSACNGMNLNWQYSEKEESFSIYGTFNIMPFEFLFGGATGDVEDADNPDAFYDVLWNDLNTDKEIKERRFLKIFESMEGEQEHICLDYNEPTTPELVLVSELDLFRPGIDLNKYLGVTMETMGVDVFRQMVIRQEAFDHSLFDFSTMEKLEQIFPWFRFEELQEKYFE